MVKNLPAVQETQVEKIPWRRTWQPTPVFLPGESHGQRSLVGYSSWGRKELDMTEATEHVLPKQGAQACFHYEQEDKASLLFPWESEIKMEGSFSIWTLEDYGRKKGSGQWEIGFFFSSLHQVGKLGSREGTLTWPSLWDTCKSEPHRLPPLEHEVAWFRINETEKNEWAKRVLLMVLQASLTPLSRSFCMV